MLALYLIAITRDLQVKAETRVVLIYSLYSLYDTQYFKCCDNPEFSRVVIQEYFESLPKCANGICL